MSSKFPLVSIIVPCYNHDEFIEKTIDSIISQDYPHFELIVIDDGSSDNSPQLLHQLQQKYKFILECNKNQGVSKTLNRGFRDLANGKYLTFCASDDYWLPGKLSKQVKFLEENSQYAMVYGKSKFIDHKGEFQKIETDKRNENLKGGFIFKNIILFEFHPPVNYMLRADVVKEIGYYRDHIWAEDFDMNLRISNKYPIGFIDDYLSCYRIANSSNRKMLNFKTIYSHFDSINQYKDSPFYKQSLKNWYYRCFLWYAPYVKGKKIAFIGMIHNLNKFYTKEFIIFLLVLIRRWK
jgi:glycosyltransferase involved in cell wall biosynthesis